MARLPKITLQGWTADGPAYTVHREIAGFRNRHARRAGTGAEELVGDHDAIDDTLEDPAAYMVMASGETEVYAFKGGHVYQVTLLVDGDGLDVLVDARDGDRLEKFGGDLQLLEQRALEGEELEAALADGPEQSGNVSDAAESQDPITTLTGAQIEQPELTDAQVDELDTKLDEAADAARDAAYVSAANELFPEPPAGTPVSAEDAANAATPRDPDAGNPDTDEPSTGEMDYDGTVPEFVELLEAFEAHELQNYAAIDSRKGVREAAARELERRSAAPDSPEDHEDAVGGDGDSASSEGE